MTEKIVEVVGEVTLECQKMNLSDEAICKIIHDIMRCALIKDILQTLYPFLYFIAITITVTTVFLGLKKMLDD